MSENRDAPLPAKTILMVVVTILGACALTSGALLVFLRYAPRDAIVPETMAVFSLRSILSAQQVYQAADKDGNGKKDFGTLPQLAASGLIEAELGAGTKHGYVFETAPGTAAPLATWWALARPVRIGEGSRRAFYVSHKGEVRGCDLSARPPGDVPRFDPRTAEFPSEALPLK